jgi:hypothetical protein
MEMETELYGSCTFDNWCDYHLNKKDNEMCELPQCGTKIAGGFEVEPCQELDILSKMGTIYGPAGSWLLMNEQKQWYASVLKYCFVEKQKIEMLNLGIAGLPHAKGTVKIIKDAMSSDQKVDLYFLDKCIKPLLDIKEFYNSSECSVSVNTINGNATDIPQDLSFDVISAHFLFSFCSEGGVKKIMENVNMSLKDGGVFALAVGKQDYMDGDVSGYFEQFGFSVTDCTQTWDVYDLTPEDITAIASGKSVIAPKDNLLLKMKKGGTL